MPPRNERDRKARRGRYALRDLAGFADIERLLANEITGELLPSDTADDADPADVRLLGRNQEVTMPETEKPKPEKPETRPTDDGYLTPTPPEKKIIEPAVSRASHFS